MLTGIGRQGREKHCFAAWHVSLIQRTDLVLDTKVMFPFTSENAHTLTVCDYFPG